LIERFANVSVTEMIR